MADVITNPEPMSPAVQSPDVPPTGESLSDRYSRLAGEFRTLTRKQYEIGLDPDEIKRKRELNDMAEYGLFFNGQIESLLVAREKIYLAHRSVVSQELANPEQLAEEYRNLNKKSLSSEGLKPEDLERWMHLRMLANSGAFQNLDKAA